MSPVKQKENSSKKSGVFFATAVRDIVRFHPARQNSVTAVTAKVDSSHVHNRTGGAQANIHLYRVHYAMYRWKFSTQPDDVLFKHTKD